MSKIVCDFEMVDVIANNIKNLTDEMINTTMNYQTTISNDLLNWQGKAQDTFIGGVQSQITNINNHVNTALVMAEFIKKASEQIRTAEEELATLKI